MSTEIFIARIFTAFVLGMLIGIERQRRQRMAGLRTNTLVCVGSAIFVTLTGLTGGETTRVAAQVVSGIGFLGAGVIMREGVNVRGLNTAATLWCAAAVGVLAGMGFIMEATIGTAAVTAVHLLLRPLAARITRNAPLLSSTDTDLHFQFSVHCGADDAAAVRAALVETVNGDAVILRGGTRDVENEPEMRLVEIEILATTQASNIMELLTRRMGMFQRVHSVRWERLPSEN
jgi:putative Mg2+ transporter-C (MgtC) family protein